MLPGYTSAPRNPNRRTGAIPTPRHRLAAATPHKYIGGAPDFYYRVPQTLSMWLNDQEGDCVSAEEAFNQATQGIFISDRTLNTFVNRNDLANGAMLDQVLDLIAAQGFSQDGNTYKVGSKSTVDYTNWAVLTDAIFRGAVKIGIASGNLDGVVGQHNGWFLMDARRDDNEDHCVSLPGYGTAAQLAAALGVTVPSGVDGSTKSVMLYTWKTIGIVAYDALLKFMGEAWLRNPNSITVGTGTPTPDVVVTPTPPTPTPPVPPVPPVPPTPSPDVHPTLDITGNAHLFGLHIPFEGVAVPRQTATTCCGERSVPYNNLPAATWTPPVGWLAVSMDVSVMLMDILAKDWGKLVTDSLKLAKDCGLNVQGRRQFAPAPSAIHWWGLFSDVLAIAAALRSGDPAVIDVAIQKFLADLGL